MSFRYLKVEHDDGVVTARIDNLDNKNAVNDQMNREFVELARMVDDDPSARVLILTGTGHIFCSGADIKRMTAEGKAPHSEPETLRSQLRPHLEGIRAAVLGFRAMSKPVIAAINGHAVGSGVGLAAGCDIRIASTDAKIGWVFTKRGIVADDASLALMPELIGYSNAFYWGATGRTLSATEAKAIGFCQEVVAPEELLPASVRLAREIIENCPPITTELFKMVSTGRTGLAIEDRVALASRAYEISRRTEDQAEALHAYGERRKPVWKRR